MESELCYASVNFPEPPTPSFEKPEIVFDTPSDEPLNHIKFVLTYKTLNPSSDETDTANSYAQNIRKWIDNSFALLLERHAIEIRKMKDHITAITSIDQYRNVVDECCTYRNTLN